MTPATIGNKGLIRTVNRALVLNAVKTQGPVGRAEIARTTGLSPASVTGIASDLIGEGLIFEKDTGDSSGGRPPILLALNPKAGFVLGAKLMEDHAIGALTDLEACVIAKGSEPLRGRSPEDACSAIATLADRLLAETAVPHSQLMGVGVGLAGIVEPVTGILRQSPFFGWQDVRLRDLLQEEVHAPVMIDNDVNTLTLAESLYGGGQGIDHFLTLTVGRGIGLGIVLFGQLYRGAGGGAGEFGHAIVTPGGPLCECGRRGCLQALAGDLALIRMAQAAHAAGRLPPVTTTDELLAEADAGNTEACAIFATAGQALGQAIANLVVLLNPRRILVSGEGTRYGEHLFGPMTAVIREQALPVLLSDVDIRVEPWGDDMWARGAASLVLGRIFESPINQAA